jgi:hypothetical protein
MNNIVTRNVDELSAPSRQHLEQIVGRELPAHQKIYIIVGLMHPKPSAAAKRKSVAGLRKLIGSVKPPKKVSASEADRIVDEAVRDTRHS